MRTSQGLACLFARSRPIFHNEIANVICTEAKFFSSLIQQLSEKLFYKLSNRKNFQFVQFLYKNCKHHNIEILKRDITYYISSKTFY